MNKPKLSLALSLLALAGQAGLMPVVAAPNGDFEPNKLIAQAAPDQSAYVTSQPIPPVVNGVVEFEEFKTTNAIDLKVSQSRTFKFKNKIVRTSISDPGIAEPVVVSENQMVLLGKSPGTCTMLLWDDAGNSISVDLRVSKDYSQLQATLREIDPRIIVKAYNVGGSDRVLLTGDVDHPESIIRAFAASNVFMDDRGMNIQVANSRIVTGRIGESGTTGGGGGGGGQSGQLAQLNSVDRYTFFGNIPNNIGKAQVMLSDGGRVTSLVKVRKVPLIALHVSFMEMNTAAARELGTQLGFGISGNGYAFGIGGLGGAAASNVYTGFGGFRALQALTNGTPGGAGNGAIPVSIGGTQVPNAGFGGSNSIQPVSFVSTAGVRGFGQPLLLNAPATLLQQAVLLAAPGGASITPGGLINMFTALTNFGRQNNDGSGPQFSINPTIQGIISNRRARVLAEPTLVTISGERASFLAGGEIPIIQQVATAGTALNSVTFEPFGMRINMIPVLQENGTINLEVSPEERIISAALAFSLGPGTQQQIPGFTTRKSQTIVELKPGQELFLCGLVSSNNGRELSKLPMLGEIPVLGALYRSKAFNKTKANSLCQLDPRSSSPVLLVNSSCPKKSVVWKDLVT
ncbi:MAG: pilus assembly protein N-terminal domain-containing protein [Candidatus Obscuribacter sp.]|nr:pilus assembly protein N-terminal domain-containing protein [Candidatus Obscuribacter sp.]